MEDTEGRKIVITGLWVGLCVDYDALTTTGTTGFTVRPGDGRESKFGGRRKRTLGRAKRQGVEKGRNNESGEVQTLCASMPNNGGENTKTRERSCNIGPLAFQPFIATTSSIVTAIPLIQQHATTRVLPALKPWCTVSHHSPPPSFTTSPSVRLSTCCHLSPMLHIHMVCYSAGRGQ